MQIDDLTSGLSLSFIIHLNNEELQFESRILEVYSRRHTLWLRVCLLMIKSSLSGEKD